MPRLLLRLGAFYLFYFASLGALIPYWSLYLRGVGFDAIAIGQLTGIALALRVVAPNLWAWWADHTRRRMALIRWASFLAALSFAGVLLGQSFLWMAGVMALYTFFWTASLPQFEATTLNHLGEARERYGQVRLWGSVGFIAAVLAVGALLERYDTALLPPITLVLFVAIWLSSLAVRDHHGEEHPDAPGRLREVLADGRVRSLLAVCFLMQAAFATYYVFFSLHLEDLGYRRDVIGALWALGVVAEIGVFMIMARLLRRASLASWLVASLVITALRWVLIGHLADSIAILLLAQVLHMFSFGVFHAVVVELIHRAFPGRLQGRGQALYSSIGFGAGGALGSIASGYLWSSAGPAATYSVAALLTALAAVVAVSGGAGRIPCPSGREFMAEAR